VTFPQSGRLVPEIGQADIREILVQDIRIIYKVGDDVVLILAVRHGARLLGDIPGL
jgi:plasmid stabilization system protein ParE